MRSEGKEYLSTKTLAPKVNTYFGSGEHIFGKRCTLIPERGEHLFPKCGEQLIPESGEQLSRKAVNALFRKAVKHRNFRTSLFHDYNK
jgi:hypothetical protein